MTKMVVEDYFWKHSFPQFQNPGTWQLTAKKSKYLPPLNTPNYIVVSNLYNIKLDKCFHPCVSFAKGDQRVNQDFALLKAKIWFTLKSPLVKVNGDFHPCVHFFLPSYVPPVTRSHSVTPFDLTHESFANWLMTLFMNQCQFMLTLTM